jgi:hypothetical protein
MLPRRAPGTSRPKRRPTPHTGKQNTDRVSLFLLWSKIETEKSAFASRRLRIRQNRPKPAFLFQESLLDIWKAIRGVWEYGVLPFDFFEALKQQLKLTLERRNTFRRE